MPRQTPSVGARSHGSGVCVVFNNGNVYVRRLEENERRMWDLPRKRSGAWSRMELFTLQKRKTQSPLYIRGQDTGCTAVVWCRDLSAGALRDK